MPWFALGCLVGRGDGYLVYLSCEMSVVGAAHVLPDWRWLRCGRRVLGDKWGFWETKSRDKNEEEHEENEKEYKESSRGHAGGRRQGRGGDV